MVLLVMFMVSIWTLRSTWADDFLSCCGNDALACLKSQHSARQVTVPGINELPAKKFTMFTYETKNILDYALYSFAVNSVYAQHHGYSLVSTTSENGFEFETQDQRWNKVKIMETFMTALSQTTTTSSDQYLVWLDSDLIVLNFDLDLSALVTQHPQADLIISADVEPLNGMVNTGCMIVRVSEWSRLFFQEWWDATERVNGMDQHVFDLIYKRRKNASAHSAYSGSVADNVETKIAILPTYALNSHIPASKHQQPHHNILHLAGESAAVRAYIFKAAFSEVCRAHQFSKQIDPEALNTMYLKPQLGVSREFLQSIDYNNVLYEAVRTVWTEMQTCSNIPPPTGKTGATSHRAVCDASRVLQLQARLRDTMQSRDLVHTDSAVHGVYLEALRWTLLAHTHLTDEFTHLHTSAALAGPTPTHVTSTPATPPTPDVHTIYSAQTHLNHLQYVLDASFELLTVDKDPTSVQKTLTAMVVVLNLVQDKFMGDNSPSQGPMLYYQFKYYDFLATYYALLHMPTRELESLQQARTTWDKMAQLQYYGTGNTVSDPYRALADLLARMAALECRNGVHYSDIEGGRFERGLKLVFESAGFTARRWLPANVYETILQYTASDCTASSTASNLAAQTHSLRSTDPTLHFDRTHLAGVPIKMLSTLVQNYALAAQCANRLIEARENSALFDALGDSADVGLGGMDMAARYERVSTELCKVLHGMGYECVFAGSAVSIRAYVPAHDEQHNHEQHSHNSEESIQQWEAHAPKRVVKLKRKLKQ